MPDPIIYPTQILTAWNKVICFFSSTGFEKTSSITLVPILYRLFSSYKVLYPTKNNSQSKPSCTCNVMFMFWMFLLRKNQSIISHVVHNTHTLAHSSPRRFSLKITPSAYSHSLTIPTPSDDSALVNRYPIFTLPTDCLEDSKNQPSLLWCVCPHELYYMYMRGPTAKINARFLVVQCCVWVRCCNRCVNKRRVASDMRTTDAAFPAILSAGTVG